MLAIGDEVVEFTPLPFGKNKRCFRFGQVEIQRNGRHGVQTMTLSSCSLVSVFSYLKGKICARGPCCIRGGRGNKPHLSLVPLVLDCIRARNRCLFLMWNRSTVFQNSCSSNYAPLKPLVYLPCKSLKTSLPVSLIFFPFGFSASRDGSVPSTNVLKTLLPGAKFQ